MNIELLKKLTETAGPSGFEQRISSTIAELWEPLADSVTVDRLGSVIATKNGRGAEPRPSLLLAAHLDEIGLMVSQILTHNGYGFMRVTQLGGVDIPSVRGEGQLTLHLSSLMLSAGAYMFSFSIHSTDHKTNYHRLDNCHVLACDSDAQSAGPCAIASTWQMSV